MITTIITAMVCTSGGYLFGAVWASGKLVRRVASLKADLADTAEALKCRDEALAAHMFHIGDQRRMLITKDKIIDDLEAQADRLGELADCLKPARDARGHFVSKKVG